jgi:hypothetical protein
MCKRDFIDWLKSCPILVIESQLGSEKITLEFPPAPPNHNWSSSKPLPGYDFGATRLVQLGGCCLLSRMQWDAKQQRMCFLRFPIYISILTLAAIVAFVTLQKGDVALELSTGTFKFVCREKLAQQKLYREADEPDLVPKPDKPTSTRNREK